MPFLDKAPCHAARVLFDYQCPPFDVEHNIDDFPVYYDPLYYPLLYPHIMSTSQSVCDWLASAINNHLYQCHKCFSSLPSLKIDSKISFENGFFVISDVVSHFQVVLPLYVLEKSSYVHCHVFHDIISKAASIPRPLFVRPLKNGIKLIENAFFKNGKKKSHTSVFTTNIDVLQKALFMHGINSHGLSLLQCRSRLIYHLLSGACCNYSSCFSVYNPNLSTCRNIAYGYSSAFELSHAGFQMITTTGRKILSTSQIVFIAKVFGFKYHLFNKHICYKALQFLYSLIKINKPSCNMPYVSFASSYRLKDYSQIGFLSANMCLMSCKQLKQFLYDRNILFQQHDSKRSLRKLSLTYIASLKKGKHCTSNLNSHFKVQHNVSYGGGLPLSHSLYSILDSDPCWFHYSDEHFRLLLSDLSFSELLLVAKRFTDVSYHSRLKKNYIECIINHFKKIRTHLSSLNDNQLFLYLDDVAVPNNVPRTRYTVIAAYMIDLYGHSVAHLFRTPPKNSISSSIENIQYSFMNFKWLSLSKADAVSYLSLLPLATLQKTLIKIPSCFRPLYKANLRCSCAEAIYTHISEHCLFLQTIDLHSFCNHLISSQPFLFDYNLSHGKLVEIILENEYQSLLEPSISSLSAKKVKQSAVEKERRRVNKLQKASDVIFKKQLASDIWPTKVPQKIVFDCLRTYYINSQWKLPEICAVCARQKYGLNINNVIVCNTELCRLNLYKLQVKDSFILQKTDSDTFTYNNALLNGLMLDHQGLSSDGSSMNIYIDCYSPLLKEKMPRFALANKLYRGRLPDEFRDLTWVEEMVCCIYRNTAHITRIFQSSDATQPKLLSGNTCAHEMNIVSTASVLPRTPSDISGMLSIVFIGPGNFNANTLKHVFHIRKHKVWNFLLWLKQHNHLYNNIPLDEEILDMYPNDGILPGLDNCVITDHNSDAYSIFAEETAGFSEHPSEVAGSPSSINDDSVCFLEKMGVSDPEGDKIKGHTFTASVLRNLVSDSAACPDLVLHHSSNAIPEYSNPDLIPGMYPTLFPFGIGGFEDKHRETPIQFNKQAEYYFDLPDKSFHLHHSYMFVVWNILQRRMSHLHTHLSVKKSHFSSIAKKLTNISPEVITDVANHIEHEGKYKDLSPEHKEVFELLKQVNTVAAKIPGSHGSKNFIRNEIRNYIAYFGVPQIYFTFNPSAVHSPIFQVMFGDKQVDLSDHFPELVSSRERSLRLAQDPVAAADFFEFCVSCLFQYLLGWDFNKKTSTKDGGILGHLQAFYGTTEFTERGSLHAHFVIWLVGGLNPSDLHEKLKDNDKYQSQFFEFFEDIIHHHLPDIEYKLQPECDPRTERPPAPPAVSTNIPLDILNSWNSAFLTEIKKCGEKLQRHEHRKVCYKYGNEGKCRFLFPHEIVQASYFDPETNSVVLMCHDSTVNYFNPYILVFCHHNHDIKCILSGKAAKSAMFYITDYITKMDVKTYEMLSLLSRAVSKMPSVSNPSVVDNAKLLLHKCLAQFSRQQQIHAQQAARYLRGFGDAISSHNTKPMLSCILMSNLETYYNKKCVTEQSLDENYDDPDDLEESSLLITTDKNGKLQETNQFHDYWYRGDTLESMNFYDFCRCVRLEHKKFRQPVNTPDTRLGVLTRHSLNNEHPLHQTHQLIEYTNEQCGECSLQLIPRVVGMSIPRKGTKLYELFALAHFKPFSPNNLLIKQNETIPSAFQSYQFDNDACKIMKNWDAIYECEDARDAERMHKKSLLTASSQSMSSAVHSTLLNSTFDEVDVYQNHKMQNKAEQDFKITQIMSLLQQSQWLSQTGSPLKKSTCKTIPLESIPDLTLSNIKKWKTDIQNQEIVIMENRHNAANPDNQLNTTILPTELNIHQSQSHITSDKIVLATENLAISDHQRLTPEQIINKVGHDFNLNRKQWIAFSIIARHFISEYVLKDKLKSQNSAPLRMLLTGPGGTGKTHIIKAVKEVMCHYQMEYAIRFLAPTGSAAALIDGMTIHKGLGIKIKAKDKGKGNRAPGDTTEDYAVVIGIKNRTQLREEWRNVEIVLIDEASLLSAELLSEIDSALRYAKEKPNDWFGGINVIFSGDFYQYPPVAGTALYTPISYRTAQNDIQIAKRLGRLAWKTINTVVSLSEQQCMKDDPEYANAVNNLRNRQCTDDDLDLFNSRVIKSAINPQGVDMGKIENYNASAIVQTNLLREIINTKKAEAICSPVSKLQLFMCAAVDKVDSETPSKHVRQQLLHLNLSSSTIKGALPNFIPLYIGMPVILRMRNLSTELGITNGAQGIIRKISTGVCPSGFTYCKGVLVEFPNSKVNIPTLPPQYFPITPISWCFTTLITDIHGIKHKIKVIRQQLPIQPAFAVTGQSAQGKTLPKVLVNLHEGGFGAYVAASRAKTRDGLCITEHVTLAQLNKSLPDDLYKEMKKFDIIEQNTYIQHGFQSGHIQDIPDAESEKKIANKTYKAKFYMSDNLNESKKRKHDIENGQEITNNKKKRHDSSQSTNDSDIFPFLYLVIK